MAKGDLTVRGTPSLTVMMLASVTLLLVGSRAEAETSRANGGSTAGAHSKRAKAERHKGAAQKADSDDEEHRHVVKGYGRWHGRKRFRPDPPPRTADDARHLLIEEAMRASPPIPPFSCPYRGRDKALTAARAIIKSVPHFINFRATIKRATWRVDPAYEWRVRRQRQCLTDLRQQGVRYKFHNLDDVVDVEDDDLGGIASVPTPIVLKSAVGGVRYTSARGNPVLISCELAARLKVMSEVVARHDVKQVIIVSAYRPRPHTSFHTTGLALDIFRFRLNEPLPGPRGELDSYLTVLTDFYATPNRATCDPEMFGPQSPYGRNERGRRILKIACELHDTGIFASMLTPNYNPGHRDHFHVDIRPDDPRIFLR